MRWMPQHEVQNPEMGTVDEVHPQHPRKQESKQMPSAVLCVRFSTPAGYYDPIKAG